MTNVALPTIEILFNFTEVAGFWAVDKCMNVFYPILEKKIENVSQVKVMLENGCFRWLAELMRMAFLKNSLIPSCIGFYTFN